MRFRTKARPRGLLRSSDQRRLTLLMLAVAVVLIGFNVAQRPAFWAGLFEDSSADSAAQSDASADAEFARYIDGGSESTSGRSSLRSDEFLVADRSATSETRTAFKLPAEADAEGDDSDMRVRVKPELLKDVNDDVVGVHSAEAEAYYTALRMAQRFEQRPNLTAPKAAFALFMADPAAARGLPWKVSGTLRRLTAVRHGQTMHGIGTMYEGWLTTADSGDQLVHVVGTSTSPALAKLVGEQQPDRTVDFGGAAAGQPEPPDIEFIGYFFKREAYASSNADGVSLAPMFVTGTIQHHPRPVVTTTRADDLYPYLGGLLLAVCAGIGMIYVAFIRSDHEYSRTRAHQLTRLPAHASFEDVSARTTAESLQDLQTAQDSSTA